MPKSKPNRRPDSGGRKPYELKCGDLFLTDIPLTEGDYVFCVKCDDYVEYIRGGYVAQCTHQMFLCKSTAEMYMRIKAHARRHGTHEFTLTLPSGVRTYTPEV